MRTRTVTSSLALAACLATAVLAGCGPVPEPRSSPAATSASTGAVEDPAFEAVVAASIAFRREFGLRADEAWVRQIAADPASSWTYDVALSAAEEAELDRRAGTVSELAPILQAYGAEHDHEYAGMYVDQARAGVLVLLVTGHVEEHAAAIAELVRPGTVEVRLAPMAEADLSALMETVTDDPELRRLGVFVLSASGDELRGIVQIEVSTRRDDAQGLVTGLFGPAVRVEVVDPTGAFLLPRGTVVGRVVDGEGRGVEAGLGDRPLFGRFGLDAAGKGTNPDGTFRLERQLAGRWRITAFADGYVDTSVDVEVAPGGLVTVEIVLAPA